MFKSIIKAHKALKENAYCYFNNHESDPTYFGGTTLLACICGTILAFIGLVSILSTTDGIQNNFKYVMFIGGVLSIAFGIAYAVTSDKVIGHNYNNNDIILLQIFAYLSNICSGFILVVLSICIIVDTFAIFVYYIPQKILNYITNNEKEDNVKTLTKKFIHYEARNY